MSSNICHLWACVCTYVSALPAESDVAVLGVLWRRARFQVGHVEEGERVVDEAVHGARLAVHVLVDESGDEV